MVLGFSERRKSFSSSFFLLKTFKQICLTKCNLHFQSVLVCLVLNAESLKCISLKCPIQESPNGLPSHYSICPSQLEYLMKNVWLKASVLHEQLLSSVPYAILCPICNSTFMIFVYWTIHQSLWLKINFFLQI